MYITPKQRRRSFWITIVLMLGLPLTVIAAIMAYQYYTGAAGNEIPKNVVITNLTSNSVSITWTTDIASAGSVTTSSGKGDSTPFIDIRGTDRRKTHQIDVVDLDPAKDYTFVILSNDKRYSDEKGKSFKFRTSPVTAQTPVPTPVYGSIEGTDKEDALIYITVDGKSSVYPASSATTATGKWIVDLSALRDPASKDLVAVISSTKITVTVKGTDTLGGSISGTYGELVDSEGQLKTPIQLNDVPTDTLFAQIPAVSQVSAISTPITDNTGGTSNGGTDNSGNNGGTDNGGTDNGGTDSGVIATDVSWESIKGTNITTTTSTSPTGKSSVQITNITDTGFNVVWLTPIAQEGQVKYGTTATSLSETALDERDSATSKGKYTSHSVKLSRLLPNTEYFFEIYSDSAVIKDGDSPFSVKTFDTLSNPPEFKTVTGKIENIADGSDSIAVIQLTNSDSDGTTGQSSLSSTLPDANGNWVATLGDIRNSDGTSYFTYSDKDTISTQILALTPVKTVKATTSSAIQNGVVSTASAQTNRTFVKIPALSNYNVYSGTVPSTPKPETGSGGDTNNGSGYTPKTALTQPLIITITVGILSVILGSAIYLKSQRKYTETKAKEKMISSVI